MQSSDITPRSLATWPTNRTSASRPYIGTKRARRSRVNRVLAVRRDPMRWAGALRRELSARNREIAIKTGSLHELTAGEMPSVIFDCDAKQHGNFHPAAYRNICANRE